jgi:hypothetical protein
MAVMGWTKRNRYGHDGGTAAAGMRVLGIGWVPETQRSSLPSRVAIRAEKFAAALDNAIEKYYLRFHDRSDAG